MPRLTPWVETPNRPESPRTATTTPRASFRCAGGNRAVRGYVYQGSYEIYRISPCRQQGQDDQPGARRPALRADDARPDQRPEQPAAGAACRAGSGSGHTPGPSGRLLPHSQPDRPKWPIEGGFLVEIEEPYRRGRGLVFKGLRGQYQLGWGRPGSEPTAPARCHTRGDRVLEPVVGAARTLSPPADGPAVRAAVSGV